MFDKKQQFTKMYHVRQRKYQGNELLDYLTGGLVEEWINGLMTG